MKDIMGMYALIAAEYHMHLPDTASAYHLQFLAASAEKRRNDRLEAAKNGQTYVG